MTGETEKAATNLSAPSSTLAPTQRTPNIPSKLLPVSTFSSSPSTTKSCTISSSSTPVNGPTSMKHVNALEERIRAWLARPDATLIFWEDSPMKRNFENGNLFKKMESTLTGRKIYSAACDLTVLWRLILDAVLEKHFPTKEVLQNPLAFLDNNKKKNFF